MDENKIIKENEINNTAGVAVVDNADKDASVKSIAENTEKTEQDIAIQITGLKKRYKLGLITAGTLKGDIQSWWARKRGKEDPTLKIGAKVHSKNEVFWALNGIDLTIYKGERIGIIGHNGAGKSTLLKLLARVTGPTEGEIKLDGRITSMLEVGTGFNGELTGRENIYLNGAILGMTKAEVDKKIEQIIDFSECRQFIDTPVKRYSSGMFVKLAFSVAAHLDSEIMIMDEVLAVGDMAFQKKCLEKMSEVSKDEGRTILYVSHNMNTIRQLCSRCVVLNHGQIIFNGDVEEAIGIYLGIRNSSESDIDLSKIEREKYFKDLPAKMQRIVLDNKTGAYDMNSKLNGKLFVYSEKTYKDVILGFFILSQGVCVTSSKSKPEIILKEKSVTEIDFEIDLNRLAPGSFTTKLVLSLQDEDGHIEYLDVLLDCYSFTIEQPIGAFHNRKWNSKYSGFFVGEELKINQ